MSSPHRDPYSRACRTLGVPRQSLLAVEVHGAFEHPDDVDAIRLVIAAGAEDLVLAAAVLGGAAAVHGVVLSIPGGEGLRCAVYDD